MAAGAIGAGRRLVQARRVAHRTLDEVVQQGDRDVVEEQAADRLVDSAERAQRSGEGDPAAADGEPRRGHRHRDEQRREIAEAEAAGGRRQPADDERAFASDDHEPEPRWNRGAERREHEGRGPEQRVLHRERGPERAAVHLVEDVERIRPCQGDEPAEESQRDGQRAHPEERDLDGRSTHGMAPFTPSTRYAIFSSETSVCTSAAPGAMICFPALSFSGPW